MESPWDVEVTVDKELIEIIDKLRVEIQRLTRFELAMDRMAAQYIHPKQTATQMAEEILKAKTL